MSCSSIGTMLLLYYLFNIHIIIIMTNCLFDNLCDILNLKIHILATFCLQSIRLISDYIDLRYVT